MYCIVILYSWLLPGQFSSILVAILCTVLSLIAFSQVPQEGGSVHYQGINMLISIFSIWLSAALVTMAKRSFNDLEGIRDELKFEVERKTELLDSRVSELKLINIAINEVQDYSILILDINGNIRSWNLGAQRIKGYQAHEAIGKKFTIFYPPEDLESGKPERLLRTAIEKKRVQDEGWRLRKDGTRFWASVTFSTIHDESGELMGFSKVTRDLTESRKIQEARESYSRLLEVRNKELEQFAYIASHDLQEPLRTVASMNQLIEEEYGSGFDEMGKKCLNYTKQATERMTGLIRGLLEYSRIGKDQEVGQVNVSELMDEIKEDLQVLIKETGSILETGPLPVITGRRTLFRMLLQNLVGNAIKFRKEGQQPVVEVRAQRRNTEWEFSVKDNGIGIDPKYFDRIFLIFQILHKRGEYEGSGIGLAHCQRIVEIHNGRIWVESEPNKGAKFFFTVPFQPVNQNE